MPKQNKSVCVVIPAFNEEASIGDIVRSLLKLGYSVLVIDDGSSDRTAEVTRRAGAKVVRHKKNLGYIEALRTGFKIARGSIIVTMDADGEHKVEDVKRLISPILKNKADLVIGARGKKSFSERMITLITQFRVKISDASSGFRALRRSLALRMKLKGICTCGTFIIEAKKLGANIVEVPISSGRRLSGASRIKKRHLLQILIVIKEVLT